MITFEKWLLKQRRRQDPIGDLSRDFYHARFITRSLNISWDKCDEKHLNYFDASLEAFDALEEARKEYNVYIQPLIDHENDKEIIMPLKKSKSKKAFSENVKTEMNHGKSQKQSVAIAYSVKRKAAKKKK